MITIELHNSGGVLDTRTARTATEACQAAIQILTELGELYHGDSIQVHGEEEPKR